MVLCLLTTYPLSRTWIGCFEPSVVTAGKSRLRPVLMTTATTVLGMIPMAIGGGQGSRCESDGNCRNRWFDDIQLF